MPQLCFTGRRPRHGQYGRTSGRRPFSLPLLSAEGPPTTTKLDRSPVSRRKAMGFLSNILMHPEMLALGALAISVPIIIHLLNRRRFKEVDWAAMEFLLDAEQKNKKRVRLEHWILLLLRCLTMLLIGTLIAPPSCPPTFQPPFLIPSNTREFFSSMTH